MKHFVILCAAVLCLVTMPKTGVAQTQQQTLDDLMADPPATQKKRLEFTGKVPLFDSVLIHPMADWMPREMQADPLSSTRFRRQRKENAFQMEMVPKEETFANWKNLYAVLGFRNYPGNNATHAREIVRSFQAGCNPSNLSVAPLRGNPQVALIVIACGSFTRQAENGEVAAFVLLQRGKTVARLYRVWRGPAFRSEDPDQWPVTRKSFERIVNLMTRARLTPLDQPAGDKR